MTSVRRGRPGSPSRTVRSRKGSGTTADERLLAQIAATVRRVVPGAEVIVFGSRARGEADPESDWDVLVLVDEPATPALYDRIHRPLYGLGLANDMVISLIVQDRRAWESPAVRASPLYRNVRREGRWL
ncbi:nucleotidyltransferase domain-containing protein [Geochorda subterranea]|uniref:nucleotidyltransferase domain-containing protein n=1 Tax=Geochorda subterranea TaxID=3109564 RepID=UPI0038601FB5